MAKIDISQRAVIIKEVAAQLASFESYSEVCHKHSTDEPMPSSERLAKLVNLLREVIFPGYFGNTTHDPATIDFHMGVYIDEILEVLSEQIFAGLCFVCKENKKTIEHREKRRKKAVKIALEFIASLPELRELLVSDVNAAFLGDPAATSVGEVIFCYPTIRAISNYRIAHKLLKLDVPLIPRIISEMAHSETGIDIHPKAEIEESFAIDHGTGVVIGATAIIGKNVKLYQGVTLGARSFPLDDEGNPIKGIARHPIIKDNVIIYAQATILGRITIGENSIIGGNVWVTNNLPANSRVIQVRARDASFIDGAGI